MSEWLRDVCAVANGPVNVAVAAADDGDREAILRQARLLAQVDPCVVVTLPATDAGFEVLRACAAERICAGMGACDSPERALAAARAGAAYLSAPIGRAAGVDADDRIRKLVALLRAYALPAEVVARPIKSPSEVIDAAVAGAHAAAVPAAVLRELPAASVRNAGGR
jgi:transaldolase